MEFPAVETGYFEAKLDFERQATPYEFATIESTWSDENGVWARSPYDDALIDTSFFNWERIDEHYRQAVAGYYLRRYPELPMSSEPADLKYFFCGREFAAFAGSQFGDELPNGVRELYAFSLGPWPAFRDCLIANDPMEAAHLAAVVREQTANDWKPVGHRDESDPLKFLHQLQAGRSVSDNVRFTLYRLQR